MSSHNVVETIGTIQVCEPQFVDTDNQAEYPYFLRDEDGDPIGYITARGNLYCCEAPILSYDNISDLLTVLSKFTKPETNG